MPNPAYLPAFKVQITVGGTRYLIQEGSYAETLGEWDATNITGATNTSGALNAEHGTDVIETTLDFTFIIDGNNLQNLKTNTFFATSYIGSDGETNSGQWRCLKRSKPVATRGGFRVQCSGKFSGAVTGQ